VAICLVFKANNQTEAFALPFNWVVLAIVWIFFQSIWLLVGCLLMFYIWVDVL
jgi:hypothetical protein